MEKYVSVDGYLAIPTGETVFLIDQFLAKPGRHLLIGPPKGGKSYLALQIAHAVVHHAPFLGRPSSPHAHRTLYLQFDMPPNLWNSRLKTLYEEGITFPGFCQDRTTSDFVLLAPSHQRPRLDLLGCQSDRHYLQQIMKDLTPDLVIVDTLAKLHGGDENSERSMKAVFHQLNDIFGDCAVIYVHHTHKLSPPPGQKAVHRPKPADAARGSSFLTGEVDTIWLLYNNLLSTEVRFDENGYYPCHQDVHTSLWTFKEPERVARLEEALRRDWHKRAWSSWKDYRHYIYENHTDLPHHLVNRLRAELEPFVASPEPNTE
jgi:hypothetical protein